MRRLPLTLLMTVSGLLSFSGVLAGSGALSGDAKDAADGGPLIWRELPPLPPAPGRERQTGLAGPFAGVHGDVLIVGGGANFPGAVPWEGGKKVWWDDLFVLERGVGDAYRWRTDPSFNLPRPLAYGVSVTTGEGVACIGGCDGTRCYPDAFLLKWNAAGGRIETVPLPPLPRPLAFMAGARVGETLYVAGGQETVKEARASMNFFSLDLGSAARGASVKWRIHPPLPGPARILPACAVQSDGFTDCLYLFSGRRVAPGERTRVLTDAYAFNPKTGAWKAVSEIAPEGEAPRCIMGSVAVPSGTNHILFFGGDEGAGLLRREALSLQISEAVDPARADALRAELEERFEKHPGFSKEILAYNTVTDTWHRAGTLPFDPPVTTAGVPWDGAVIVPCGEVHPGVRTPGVWRGTPPPAPAFGGMNYAVLGAYLAVLVGMGIYFSRRERSTEDYFKASGRVPWWAAGLSIFGTQLSAITFMTIPAKSYATDWRYFMGNMTITMVAPFIILLFLPFYRRLNVTTAYEYLEKRFNPAARLAGSVLFVALQLGRIGIVLFLPSIALSVVTGMDVTLCILLMGVLSTSYTVLGGIEAVIWTDVLQVVVLIGGALICLAVVLLGVDGGLSGLLETAAAAGKLHTFDFDFDWTVPTFWVVILGGLAANLISYGSDQTVIQRYLTTKDERAAARSIWTNGILCVPASLLFFGMGTALYVYYRSWPGRMSVTLESGDALFPWFIVSELPQGVAGLVIAAVFAASMSSLDSSMNSVSAAVTTDFYSRFRPGAPEKILLRLARWITVVVGLAGTAFALMMAGWGIRSLLDQFLTILGLFAGGLGGLFLLGIFSRRAHGTGAVIGLIASGIVQYAVKAGTEVHLYLYTFTGMVSCILVGYLASLILPRKPLSVAGLTLFTRTREEG